MMLSRGQSGLALLALFVKPSHQWVNYYSSSLDEPVERTYQWDFPAAADSDVGLGGGLAYATQGDFCATLLPRFTSERMFDLVDCEALLSAVELGFETWSANHRFIQFHDMSRDCAGTAPAVVPAGSGADVPAEEYAAECSRLEISITAGEPLRPGHEKLAAIVYNMPYDRLGGGFWTPRFRGDNLAEGEEYVHTTARQPAREARRVELSRIHFNTQTCWYLDNSFCFGFHKYAIGPGAFDIEGLVLGLLVTTVGLALVAALVHAARVFSRLAHTPDGQRAETVWNIVEGLGRPSTFFVLLFLVMPPLCYTYIFRPCMDCYDFEAAVAHEVGHVLGFHHPDAHPERNWNATAPMGSAICNEPWADHAKLATPPEPATVSDVSIMNSLTREMPRACLTNDDLAGLNALYPTCDDAFLGINEPVCIKSKRNVGALRFAALVAMPFMVCAVFVLILVAYARRRDRARFKRIQRNLHLLFEHTAAKAKKQDEKLREAKRQVKAAKNKGLKWRGSIFDWRHSHELKGRPSEPSKHRHQYSNYDLDVSLEPGTVDWEASVIQHSAGVARHSSGASLGVRGSSGDALDTHRSDGATPRDSCGRRGSTHTAIKHAKNVVTKSGSMATLDAELVKTVAAIKGSNKELSAKTEAYRQAKRRGSDPSGGKSPHGSGSLSKEALSQSAPMPTIFSGKLPELSGGRGKLPAGAIAVEVGLADPPSESGASRLRRALGGQTQMVGITEEHRSQLERRTSERPVEVPRRSSELEHMTEESRAREAAAEDEAVKASTAGGADDARLAFWRLFEPVVRLRAMGVHHKFDDDALMGAVHRVLRFPQAQLAERSAAAAERAAVEGGDAGGDAHVSAMEVRAAYTLRRAWFERLASSEPSVLDFFVTQEHEACRAVAHALDLLAEHHVHRDLHGAPNPLNLEERSYRGLEYGPMLNHRGRALLVEWFADVFSSFDGHALEGAEGAPEASSAAAVEARRALSMLRQLLRASRLDGDGAAATVGFHDLVDQGRKSKRLERKSTWKSGKSIFARLSSKSGRIPESSLPDTGDGAERKMTELDPRFNPDLADESEVDTEFSELSAQRGQISITERTMSTGAKGI